MKVNFSPPDDMLCLSVNQTDPFLNIAMEEYLLRKQVREVFLLYRNKPSVILGKHQNAYSETCFPYLHRKGIPLIRRISGGGTVYHDEGNLNYALVLNGESGKLVDFKKHSRVVVDFLRSYGVEARFEGKNDLRVDGRKFSGNAEHVFKNSVLHHGTILFSADLEQLQNTLKRPEAKYKSRAVSSNPGVVMNLQELLPGLGMDELMTELLLFAGKYFNTAAVETFDPAENPEIMKRVREKFSTWEWNVAYAPDYSFTSRVNMGGKEYSFVLRVRKGIIREVESRPQNAPFSAPILGTPHRYEAVLKVLNTICREKEEAAKTAYAFFW